MWNQDMYLLNLKNAVRIGKVVLRLGFDIAITSFRLFVFLAQRLIFGIAITTLCLLAVLVGYHHWHQMQLRRDFDPIIYTSRDGLCSIKPSGDAPPYCPNVFLDRASLSPDGQFIAAEQPTSTMDDSAPYKRIVVANRRAVMVRPLVGSSDFMNPIWAPDGEHIIAISYDLPEAVGRWNWRSGEKTIVPI